MATDKELKAAAKELNEVMGIDPPISTKLPSDELKLKIKTAIKMIQEDDKFSDETQEVIDELSKSGKKTAEPAAKKKAAPVVEEEDEEVVEDDDAEEDVDDEEVPEEEEVEEAPAPKAKKGKKEEAPAPKKGKKEEVKKEKKEPKGKKAPNFVRMEMNRLDCVCITLKEKKPKTFAEWAEKANALYVSKGGKDNEKQTLFLVVNYGASLKHLGIAVPEKK